jgi:hypothetical protein
MSQQPLTSTGKTMQMVAMKEYITQCHFLFERLMTEVLLAQPQDPFDFMVEEMKKVTNEEKEDLLRNVQRTIMDMKVLNPTDADGNRIKGSDAALMRSTEKVGVKDITRIDLALDKKGRVTNAKETVLNAFLEIRDAAYNTGKCTNFQIFFDSSTLEICVCQDWKTVEDLQAFKSSVIYEALVPRFVGIINGKPESKQYTQHLA